MFAFSVAFSMEKICIIYSHPFTLFSSGIYLYKVCHCVHTYSMCMCPNVSIQVIGTFCMDLAIKKAKDVGMAWVNCIGELIGGEGVGDCWSAVVACVGVLHG